MDKRRCVADLEADGLLDTVTRVWCGVFKDRDTKEVFKFHPHQIPEMLQFMDTCSELQMHNGVGYDWPVLKKLYGYEYKGKKVDTLIISRLLNPKRQLPFNCPNKKIGPHSVEAWGYRVGRGKPEHEDWSQFSEEMLHRCTEDVEIQFLIYNELEKEMEKGDWSVAIPLTTKLFELLQRQEEYGWKVDVPYMRSCIHMLDHWIARIDKVLQVHLPLVTEVEETKTKGEYGYIKKPFLKSGRYSQSVEQWLATTGLLGTDTSVTGPFSRVSFRHVDLNSNAETKEFLLSSGWEPLEWNTNDEGERTSPKLSKDDPFDGINGGIGRLVARRVQCRHRKSTIEGLLNQVREDGKLPAVVKSLADTSRAIHAVIVNIPKVGSFFGKQMRKMFTCKDGWVLVGTDSDADQIRKLAGRMNDPVFINAVVNGDKAKGTDHHTLTMKAGDLESRDIAKNTMYCILFGGGDAKLAKTARKPAGSGPELRSKIYRGLNGLGTLMESLNKEWRATAKRRFSVKWNKMEYYDGYIRGLDGRPIKVPYEHQILVYLLQSDEAIAMSAAYIRVQARLEQLGYKWKEDWGMVCWYHDEYTIECKPEISKIVAREAEDAIRWANDFFKNPCPHIGHAAIGDNWFSIH